MTCQGDAVLGAEAGPAQQVLLTLLPSNHPIGTHTPEAVPSVFTDKEISPECSLVQAGLGAGAKLVGLRPQSWEGGSVAGLPDSWTGHGRHAQPQELSVARG